MTKKKPKTPSWVVYDKKETKKLIVKLAKKGYTNSEIGTKLRDQYGIPDVAGMGIKISEITPEKEIPEDLYNLLEKAINVHKHLDQNKGDSKAKHGLEFIESKIRKLAKYYRKSNKLPEDWKYSREKAELLVK